MFSHSSARKMWIPKSHRKLGRYHLSEAETPESITPLPGGQWIITKDAYDSVLVLQKNIGDSTAMEFRIEIQGIGYGHSYYSPDNGQTVYLAILSRVYNQPTMTQGSGYVFCICRTSSPFISNIRIVLIYHIVFPCGHNAVQAPEISLRKTLQLSSLDVIRHIEICGQLVLVHGKHRMAVVDWQSDSGFEATISFQPDDLLSSAMWPADSQIVSESLPSTKSQQLIFRREALQYRQCSLASDFFQDHCCVKRSQDNLRHSRHSTPTSSFRGSARIARNRTRQHWYQHFRYPNSAPQHQILSSTPRTRSIRFGIILRRHYQVHVV